MAVESTLSGRCECGDVTFVAAGEVSDFSHCHCSQCRRLHGAAFGTFAGVARNGFQFTSGEGSARRYGSSPGTTRVFCERCGSNLFVDTTAEPDVRYVCMGVVDAYPALPPAYHQFAGSRAPWHEITDDLPQFEGDVD